MVYMHYLSQGSVMISAISTICYPIWMSSTMPNTFGRSLRILPIIHWNISPPDTILNGSLVNRYLSNWNAENSHGQVLGFLYIKFQVVVSWTYNNYGYIANICLLALSVPGWVLWDLKKHTVPLHLGTMMKLLKHLAFFIPSSISIWCCSSLSSSFLNGSYST